ncbi:MAG: radical SAM protein [Clostridiales bacterium]|jgi:MoaA/NifB/PqqE/SkfB family radical SAM enzyme|nr:radical SAM protein [Clostridiales bacterium]
MSSYLALGYKCNLACIICPCTTADRLNKALSFDEIKKAYPILTINNIGQHITVSGGEPTLHHDFAKIMHYLCKAGYKITLLSNSITFAAKDNVKKIKSAIGEGAFSVVTAIHSDKAEEHDAITGVRGSHENTISGLFNLLDKGIQITIKNILNGVSYKKLTEYSSFIAKTFPPEVSICFCVMDFCGRALKNQDKLAILYTELQPFIENALDYFEQNERGRTRRIEIIETPLCLVDPYYWKYFSNKNCTNTYMAPNVEFQDKIVQEFASQCGTFYNECAECDVKNICCGTWRSAYKYLGSNLLKTIKGEKI